MHAPRTHAQRNRPERPRTQKTSNPANQTTQSTRGKHHLLGRGRPAEPHPTGATRREEKANRNRPHAKGPLAPQADKGTHGEPTPERQRPGSDILAVCGSTEWPQTARSTPGMGQPQSNAHWRAARRRDPWMPGPAGTPVVRRGRPPEHPPSEQGGKGGTKHAKHVACAQMALAKTLRAMRRRKHTCACGSVTAQAAAAEACERRRHMRTRSGTSRPTHGPKYKQPS